MKPAGNIRSVILAAAVAVSLLLHAASIFFLHDISQPLPAEPLKNPVNIRIVERSPVPEKTPPVSKPPTTKSPAKGPGVGAKQADNDEEEDEEEEENQPERPYEQFFPGPTWPAGTVTVQPGGGDGRRGPPPSTGTQKIAAHLSGQLDIPLVFRENTARSRAVAKFRKKPDGFWYFEYIDGEPVLRAVLFQAFQQQVNLDKIDQLATEMKKNELLFVLEQLTKPALDGWEQFSDQITYEDSKITYSRTIFTGNDGSSGIALPDKEAERAVMRDQVALKRLMMSPAYISRVRNRRIVPK
jgi:hypothetical protein